MMFHNKTLENGWLKNIMRHLWTRKHIIDKNNYFCYVPQILSYSKPIYLYKNKNTTLFDSDYLMVKKVQKSNIENAFIHVGMKGTLSNNVFVLNSVLVTFDTDDDYDTFFNGQPEYTIREIIKTSTEGTEITYLERNEINLENKEIIDLIHKKNIRTTSRIVKNIGIIKRKINNINEIEDIIELYKNKDNIQDARLRKIVKETYNMIKQSDK